MPVVRVRVTTVDDAGRVKSKSSLVRAVIYSMRIAVSLSLRRFVNRRRAIRSGPGVAVLGRIDRGGGRGEWCTFDTVDRGHETHQPAPTRPAKLLARPTGRPADFPSIR